MTLELPTNPEASDSNDSAEWDRLCRFIEEKYGIEFSSRRRDRLTQKLHRRLRQVPAESPAEYLRYLRDHPDEIPRLLDEVSTNKTSFFREDGHWAYLRETVLPRWSELNERIDVWSAAVSTGEELYSLFFLLEDLCRKGGPGYRGLGTDLSSEALQRAREGTYSVDDIQPIPRRYRDRFIEEPQDSNEKVRRIESKLRQRATFRQFNLARDSYPIRHRFHLIFCCNVLIYFDAEVVQHVVDRLRERLVEGGFLLVGHTESLHNLDHQLVREQPAIYRKPNRSS